ncbi:MAG: type II toxin-antitoxin system RelE/ParE family toxin [Nitrospirae bacterium]|nr:type II toxin-antitoxin system RelE/ParE family toxin [Nitrospirota bacterium]
MKYGIELAKGAESDLEYLFSADRKLCTRLFARLETLASDPFQGKPHVGNHKGEYSLRVGNYRIVYEPDAVKHIAYILTVKHRKHVY